MFEAKLNDLESRYQEVQKEVADPEVIKDQKKYKELMQECTNLAEIVDTYHSYKKIDSAIKDAGEMAEMAEDAEMKELAQEELKELEDYINEGN